MEIKKGRRNIINHHFVQGQRNPPFCQRNATSTTRQPRCGLQILWHSFGFPCPCTKWWLIILISSDPCVAHCIDIDSGSGDLGSIPGIHLLRDGPFIATRWKTFRFLCQGILRTLKTSSCPWHGCQIAGLNLETGQLSCLYKAEIFLNVTLNHDKPTKSNPGLWYFYQDFDLWTSARSFYSSHRKLGSLNCLVLFVGHLNAGNRTVAALDLGGGSTQITFVPVSSSFMLRRLARLYILYMY